MKIKINNKGFGAVEIIGLIAIGLIIMFLYSVTN